MASTTQELEAFVKEALLRGLAKPEIEQAILQAGWTADQARSALGAFADVPFAVPVPKPRPSLSAAEAFKYLLTFTTLYLSAFHLGSLFFSFIDKAFPDPASPYEARWVMDSLRWSAASLVIAFPVFLFMSHHIQSAIARDPVKRLSPIRRWLTYLTLFVAATILIGDLTTLVYNLLGGELTVRFVLKVLTVAMIAGTAFGYYLWDMRREERE
ncbi:MAG: DUF5671 domain-containing protein [Isosphaeraceae bacterium]